MTNDPTRETDDARSLSVDDPAPEAPATHGPAPEAPATGTPGTAPSEEHGGRHPLSISYLVAGLVFLGIAASWALRETGVVDAGDSSWLFPLTLVVVGVTGLVASLASSARRS